MAKQVILNAYTRPKQRYPLPECRYEFKGGKLVEREILNRQWYCEQDGSYF